MLALMDADGNIAWSGEYDEWATS
ncbi:RHS domain-containing protein [Escherichia coli]|nr:RHS domain-containing protein [Escherichia coli]EHL3370592.1 RHS domain-containing protein [Escherichia coli]EHL7849137.1 RHS domain-containing protein [Escherichia coli]EHS3588038.1 RHS domain-containing protein [Escherichia coli]EHS4334553.1 RHS domain-containing protein [Escherichia coli]